ncbi:MAG TPA: hypothetical protein VFU21_09300 [Kofleriaceae bacterium]|nr:hypothetical protein [Kofleriaceae bacterium]
MRLLLLAAALAACGSQSPPPGKAAPPTESRPAGAPQAAAADASPLPDDCANACTEIAVCWEEVNEGREYTQGGDCTAACGDAPPDEQKAFFECVARGRAECSKMVQCG